MTSKPDHRHLPHPGMVCALLFALTNQTMADPLSDSWSAAYDAGDYVKAETLLRPLAKHGDALAQFNLGFMYANGQGVPQDYVLAYMWSDFAAADTADSEFRKQYAELRNAVAKKMTARQITKAKKLERKCASHKFEGC